MKEVDIAQFGPKGRREALKEVSGKGGTAALAVRSARRRCAQPLPALFVVVCRLSSQVAFLNAMHHPCIVAIREYFEHDSGVRHSNDIARTHAQSGSIRSGPSHIGAVAAAS